MVQREGYYDYMLRRTREENDKVESVNFSEPNNMLEKTIQQMQKEIHSLQMLVKKLSEDNSKMKEQNANLHNN
jgi:TolA-binding protein